MICVLLLTIDDTSHDILHDATNNPDTARLT